MTTPDLHAIVPAKWRGRGSPTFQDQPHRGEFVADDSWEGIDSMRLNIAIALLVSGVLLPAGAFAGVSTSRLNVDTTIADGTGDVPSGAFNEADVVIDGPVFLVDGVVTGLGNNSDEVIIGYVTDFPEKGQANEKNGKVDQKKNSQVTVEIIPGPTSPTLPYVGSGSPEKCKVSAKVKGSGSSLDAGKNKVDVKCDFGEGGNAISPAPNIDQFNTILYTDGYDPIEDVYFEEFNVQ